MCLYVVARDRMHDLFLLVQDHVQNKVQGKEFPYLFQVFSDRIIVQVPCPGTVFEHHPVVSLDGGLC